MSAFGAPPLPVSRIVFNKYDGEGLGLIDSAHFGALCYDLGHFLSQDEVAFAVGMLDTSGDGKISYEEFVVWWKSEDRFARFNLSEEAAEQFRTAAEYFQNYDADKSGSIDSTEIVSLRDDLTACGFDFGTAEDFRRELDSDGNGVISFNEYIDWLVRMGLGSGLSGSGTEGTDT